MYLANASYCIFFHVYHFQYYFFLNDPCRYIISNRALSRSLLLSLLNDSSRFPMILICTVKDETQFCVFKSSRKRLRFRWLSKSSGSSIDRLHFYRRKDTKTCHFVMDYLYKEQIISTLCRTVKHTLKDWLFLILFVSFSHISALCKVKSFPEWKWFHVEVLKSVCQTIVIFITAMPNKQKYRNCSDSEVSVTFFRNILLQEFARCHLLQSSILGRSKNLVKRMEQNVETNLIEKHITQSVTQLKLQLWWTYFHTRLSNKALRCNFSTNTIWCWFSTFYFKH
jgi:hypothetical protein